MKKGSHVRKIIHSVIQTDGSKISLKMAMPVVQSEKVLQWEKLGISGCSLSLNQDSRSNAPGNAASQQSK